MNEITRIVVKHLAVGDRILSASPEPLNRPTAIVVEIAGQDAPVRYAIVTDSHEELMALWMHASSWLRFKWADIS